MQKRVKKAQVTLFVIIAIVIVVVVAGIFVYRNIAIQKEAEVNTQEITNYVQKCVDDSLILGVEIIGEKGGYAAPPFESLVTNTSTYSYWYYQGEDISPSLETIQEELSLSVKTAIIDCVNFSSFSGYEVSEGDINVSSEITDSKTSVKVKYPLTISKGDAVYELTKPFTSSQNIRLGLIYSISQGVISREILSPGLLDLTYLVSSYNIEGMDVVVNNYENSTIYTIEDLSEANQLDGNNYAFVYAIEQ